MNTTITATLLTSLFLMTACQKDDPVPPSYQPNETTSGNENGNGSSGNGGNGGYGGTPTPQTEDRTVTPPDLIRLCPNWIGGDRDFGGIARVKAKVTLYTVNQRELWSRVEFDVMEPNPDYTHANLVQNYRLFTAPTGWRVDAILSQSTAFWEFYDQDHSEDVINYSSIMSPVLRFKCKGDTGGNDVGNCTTDDSYLSVYYNPIQLRIRRS